MVFRGFYGGHSPIKLDYSKETVRMKEIILTLKEAFKKSTKVRWE